MKKNCEDCKWYKFIDSGFGNCLRFPPQRFAVKKGFLFGKIQTYNKYPIVSWDGRVCGEYKKDVEEADQVITKGDIYES